MTPRFIAALLLGPALSSGCGSTCDTEGQALIRFADGITNTQATLYQTTLPEGEYLHFPPGRRYDLVHGLRAVPAAFLTTLSFDATPLSADSDTNSVAEGSGNLVVIERQTETILRVRNDTCAEMYLRVVASTESALSDAS